MRFNRIILFYSFLLLLAGASSAEEGFLILHVTYLDREPIVGVRIGTQGDGSIEVTDRGGRARIKLAPRTKAGNEVALQVLHKNREEPWVFISPWNQRVIVPPFESARVTTIILAKRSDREVLLASSEGRVAILQSTLAELTGSKTPTESITDEERRIVLREQAAAYGLEPKEIDDAIRTLSQKSKDPYERGLAALYAEQYPLATEHLRQALEVKEEEFAGVSLELADRAFFFGESLFEEGLYSESTKAYEKSLKHLPTSVKAWNGYGKALFLHGDLTGAEIAFERALRENSCSPPKSRENLAIKANLAAVLEAQGDFEASLILSKEVVEAFWQFIGKDDIMVLSAMGNLAVILKAKGSLQEARQLEEEILDIKRRVLGPEHAENIVTINNLAQTLYMQGDSASALKHRENALRLAVRHWGVEHPQTLLMKTNLAGTLIEQERFAEARTLLESVIEPQRRLLGGTHTNVLTSMSNLAVVMLKQGELHMARSLGQDVVSIAQDCYGSYHPLTLAAAANLATILGVAGDYKKEEELIQQVLEAQLVTFGPNHLDTLFTMSQLAKVAKKRGSNYDGKMLQEKVLAAERLLLGPTHPETLYSALDLAETLREQGDLTSSYLLLVDTLEKSRNLNSRQSIITIAEWNLISVLESLGMDREATERKSSLEWLLRTDDSNLSPRQREIKMNLLGHQQSTEPK